MCTRSYSVLCFALVFGIASPQIAEAQYGELPLRSPLSTLPHFQTSQGRESHRYASFPINRYRLYDFYARQARYHLNPPPAAPGDAATKPSPPSKFLLPYPGIDGGRRGHWGATNEPTLIAYEREVDAQWTTVTGRTDTRGEYFLKHLLMGPEPKTTVAIYDTTRVNFRGFLEKGGLRTVPNPLGQKIDIWGLVMASHGTSTLRGSIPEWVSTGAGGRPLTGSGYYVNGDRAIFRNTVFGCDMLDEPSMSQIDGATVYRRSMEWLTAGDGLRFVLSFAADMPRDQSIAMTTSRTKTHLTLTLRWGERAIVHVIDLRSVSKPDAITVGYDAKTFASQLDIKQISVGSHLCVNTWIGPGAEASARGAKLAQMMLPDKPSSLNKGGKARFPKVITLAGKRNADPAASGTAYELDDIPVPFDNPYNAPMTISGIGFTPDGAAYVCTLVGDVWRVTGLDDDLQKVTWKRFASGLNLPLGVEVVDGAVHVAARDEIVVLHDLNADHEADYYERFNKFGPPVNLMELKRDAEGNFYYVTNAGIYRVSPDGRKIDPVGGGARNPLGLAVRADGLTISDSSEGNARNATCTLYEGSHPSNAKSTSPYKRILYLPRGLDNSPGTRTFLNEKRFGPLGDQLIGVSYGAGRYYTILRDDNEGTPQAAAMALPGEFASGASRLEVNPKDGQVYVVGFDGWGDRAVHEGSFTRIRYTGKPAIVPVAWQAHRNGLLVTFNVPVDSAHLAKQKFFAQQWNYVDSDHTYGSAEYSVVSPDQLGHDRLPITSVRVLDDGKTVFFEIPALRPAMTTHLFGGVKATDGSTLELNLFATINRLRDNHSIASSGTSDTPVTLAVPYKANNGSALQTIHVFFDKLAGRDVAARPVAEAVSYTPQDLKYDWINKNLIQKQCILCHNTGMPHDFSTYEGLVSKIDPKVPHKSYLYGMVETQSMPPYPLPAVSPSMKQALLQWIRMGAPK